MFSLGLDTYENNKILNTYFNVTFIQLAVHEINKNVYDYT